MPRNVGRPREHCLLVGRKGDDVLDRVDDRLHCLDLPARDEYREIGQQVGVRLAKPGVRSRRPEADCQ